MLPHLRLQTGSASSMLLVPQLTACHNQLCQAEEGQGQQGSSSHNKRDGASPSAEGLSSLQRKMIKQLQHHPRTLGDS